MTGGGLWLAEIRVLRLPGLQPSYCRYCRYCRYLLAHKANSDIEVPELWLCFQTKLLNGWKCNYILVGPAAAARPCLLCHKIFLLCHKIIFATKSIYRTPRDKLSKIGNALKTVSWKLFVITNSHPANSISTAFSFHKLKVICPLSIVSPF